MNLQQVFEQAARHHQAGRPADAEALVRQILAAHPDHPDALHMLGILAHQAGHHQPAVELIRRAISIHPRAANYHSNLGTVLAATGKLDEAIASYRQALVLAPDLPDAHNNLANALREKGLTDDAMLSVRAALAIHPQYPEALNNLGNLLLAKEKIAEAIAAFQQALSLRPNYAEAYSNLGNALKEAGQLEPAVAAYRQALTLRPSYAEAHSNLGNAMQERGQRDEAIASYRTAIALQPAKADFHVNLGNAMKEAGQIDAAISCYDRAVELGLRSTHVLNSLGNAYKAAGLLDRAIDYYRQAIEQDPQCQFAHSDLAYTIHFHPDYDPQAIFDEHAKWNRQQAAPLAKYIVPYSNDRSPNRRLRVGYVSPDLRDHPVSRFLLPLLANHDRSAFEIFCYTGVRYPDSMTAQLRGQTDVWRTTLGMNDQHLAQLIREDRIDILVDLSMHTGDNRLLMFARKPAPVQVTYLAYCSTTGLQTMDYRLTDSYLDPPGSDESCYSEKTIRLPRTYWCFQAPSQAPEVRPLPANSAGHITFGCLNNYCKITRPILDLWFQILQAVPGSQLMLHSHEGSHRQRLADEFTERGLNPSRLHFVGFLPTAAYFQQYNQIDLCLDPFPFNGGTTTCDALWMGTPVVSLSGKTTVSRAGLSILSNVGLTEFVTADPVQYVKNAIDLAGDPTRLANLRTTMRERMLASPLMDAPRFAQDVEIAYRRMWTHFLRAESVAT